MENELQVALDQVKELLAADPHNEEAQQVYTELQEAVEAMQSSETVEKEAPETLGPVDRAGMTKEEAVALEEGLDEGDRPSPLPERSEDPMTMYRDRPKGGSGNNQQIHPRSAYACSQPDFAALSKRYSGLSKHVTLAEDGVTASLDFKSEEASRELTRALLHNDHNLDWWVPKGQLIPPVTNRLNYIHWLEDLLDLSKPETGDAVRGLDIGCGANCIYPLLGASTCGWSFVGTDITDKAIDWASRNLTRNSWLEPLITVRKVSDTHDGGNFKAPSGMLANAVAVGESFHFCMCNPPFFLNMGEAGRNPNTACGGTAAEMVCKGGELAFVRATVDESLMLRERIHWYTAMLGKKTTLKEIRKYLYSCKVPVVRSTEFFQGETSRWAIAWSFAADPNTVVVPLKRAPVAGARGEGLPASPARRFVSFVLKTKAKTAAREVFGKLKGLLEAQGVVVKADDLMLKLKGTWGANKRKRGEGGGYVGGASTISFNCMVYEDSPRRIKVTGSLESPVPSADEGAAPAFNTLLSDIEAILTNALA